MGVELCGDKQVVLEALKNHGKALQFASDELREDCEVVLEALRQSEDAWVYASPKVKEHPNMHARIGLQNAIAVQGTAAPVCCISGLEFSEDGMMVVYSTVGFVGTKMCHSFPR